MIVLQIRLADVNGFFPFPLRSDCDERPQVHIAFTQRRLRTPRGPYPFQLDTAPARGFAHEIDYQPRRRPVVRGLLEGGGLLPADRIYARNGTRLKKKDSC